MFEVPLVTISGADPSARALASASGAENSATSPAPIRSEAPGLTPVPKPRSCVICRRRKVRCDKRSPCSNCRRANIACIFPSTDRPPRWASRLEHLTNSAVSNLPASREVGTTAGEVMERLRNLESLVKELSSRVEQADTAANSAAGGSSVVNLPGSSTHDRETGHQVDIPSTNAGNVQKQFGRLVIQDGSRSRYVGSGFWSRVNDELDQLKMVTRGLSLGNSDTSDDETSSGKTRSTQELERTPSERYGFLFRHNLSPSAPDLRGFHPLPSQIPFLLDVFRENVNNFAQVVHLPTLTKMVRNLRGSDMTSLTPANEALMFSIYYAAITSMEEDDVIINFGSTKTELNLKYRLGLEHALAKADFLNVPDLVLLQAFAIFLLLARRHDSPRFVWMMTGLAIRMGHALGLHRDGSNFEHLTPFEVEMRRRVWWALCMLDVRASEDQGTDYTITGGSFDTKIPLNINDIDIDPDLKQVPQEHEGLTDMSMARVSIGMCDIARQMMAHGFKDRAPSLEEQTRLLNKIYHDLEQGFLQYSTEPGNISYWVAVTVAKLLKSKMTLLIYLPVLFSSLNENLSDGLRTKLLISAIEVAEYNHALNDEQACRHWRWIFQTYTHWYAIVYILIEISRRPWSPIVERAWVSLHSVWLIPTQSHMDKNLRIWFPLRRLMANARNHRGAELERLRGSVQASELLEMEDKKMPLPSSPGPFPAGSNAANLFLERWRQLVTMPESTATGFANPSVSSPYTSQPNVAPAPVYSNLDFSSESTFENDYLGAGGPLSGQNPSSANPTALVPTMTTNSPSRQGLGQTSEPTCVSFPTVPEHGSDGRPIGTGIVPWLLADENPSIDVSANMAVDPVDINIHLEGEVDWYNWVESAKKMEWDTGPMPSIGHP